MSLEEDKAVQAARDAIVRKTAQGYQVFGAPETSVSHRHDFDRIPEFDVTQEMLSDSGEDPESWLMFGGNYEHHRYTTADVITPDNVENLELEYELSVGNGSSMAGCPIVVPGDPPIMYQTNGPDHMKAIDAREGEVLWSFTYAIPDDAILCCDDAKRGAAVWEDKVFMTTSDSGVVALDRYLGEQLWYTSTADHEVGYSATWAPVVHEGVIYTGSAGGEYGVRGFMTALDADNGDEIWKTVTNPEEEWVGDSIEQSCGTIWMTPTVDEERGRLYCPTGNPGPDLDTTVRPGPNRNTNGTLGFDMETGERDWFHQESASDIWDYDSACPRMLIRDIDIDTSISADHDNPVDVIVSGGKTGWVYIVDADSGHVYERSDPGVQQLNMFRMIPHMEEDRRLPFVPGVIGGNDWQPASYNHETGLAYFKMQNDPSEARWKTEEYQPGQEYWGGDYYTAPDARGTPEGWNEQTSAVVAIDPTTGERVWREWIQSEQYLWGGSVSTATGLLFLGTQDGEFVAYDGESGDRLWEFDTGEAPIGSSPMSWYDSGTGKQYVAVQIGGSGWVRRGERDDRLAVFAMEE